MAEFVLDDAFVSIAANDISTNVKSLTINYGAAAGDVTAMGDLTTINIGGLKEWSVDIEFNQDFTAAALDSILFPLVGTSVALVIRPDSAAKGADNPEFTGSAILTTYPPLGGSVGDVAGTSVSLVAASALARGV
jgi:hypothetical protein